MKKLAFIYTPPFKSFLFVQKTIKKEVVYGNNTLGGELSFTS